MSKLCRYALFIVAAVLLAHLWYAGFTFIFPALALASPVGAALSTTVIGVVFGLVAAHALRPTRR